MTLLLLLACVAPVAGKRETVGDTAEPTEPPDTDGDADADGFVTPEDCDDADPMAFPGALELLGDRVDSDCDGGADTTLVNRVDELDAAGVLGLDLVANATDVYLVAVAEMVASVANGVWIGRLKEAGFKKYYANNRAPHEQWTAGVDAAATEDLLLFTTAFTSDTERNLLTLVMDLGSRRVEGELIYSRVVSEFADVDLLAQDDGTFVSTGCDPVDGEVVLMQGTPEEISAIEADFDSEYTYIVDDCSVAGLVGAVVVADPPQGAFDVYGYSAENGLTFQFSLFGYFGFDLETILWNGQMHTADAEGAAGLRVVTPAGEEWVTGADVQEVDFAISDDGTLVVGFVDALGVPWVAFGPGGAVEAVSLAAWAPAADDISVVFTPEGDLLLAVREGDDVYWGRWGLAVGGAATGAI